MQLVDLGSGIPISELHYHLRGLSIIIIINSDFIEIFVLFINSVKVGFEFVHGIRFT